MLSRIAFSLLTALLMARPAHAQNTQNQDAQNPEIEKPSSSSGEQIFDWSKYKGKTEVPHPFASKGLVRITKDDVYIYKTKVSAQSRAASFRVGMFNPINLQNPDEAGQANSTFSENYTSTNNPALLFDYEWQLLRGHFGKLGLKAGSGIYVAQGNGHFVNHNQSLTPREIFTFIALPNSFGAVYRAQIFNKQLLVPYAEGGGTAFTFTELRDDNKGPKFGGALDAYFAFGTALNLTYFDNLAKIELDREYGINDVYLTLEYRDFVAITTRYDFSSDFVNAGFLMEF